MTTYLAQNQFNSATSPVVADTTAANVQPPRVAAVEPTGPSVPPGPKLPADATVSAGLSEVSVRTASDCIDETCENLKFVYECIDGTMFHRCTTCGRKAYLSATDDIPEIFRVSNLQDSRQFIPDRHDIWDAMHDPNAPRALETDPVWADDAPLFLKAIGGA